MIHLCLRWGSAGTGDNVISDSRPAVGGTPARTFWADDMEHLVVLTADSGRTPSRLVTRLRARRGVALRLERG